MSICRPRLSVACPLRCLSLPEPNNFQNPLASPQLYNHAQGGCLHPCAHSTCRDTSMRQFIRHFGYCTIRSAKTAVTQFLQPLCIFAAH